MDISLRLSILLIKHFLVGLGGHFLVDSGESDLGVWHFLFLMSVDVVFYELMGEIHK